MSNLNNRSHVPREVAPRAVFPRAAGQTALCPDCVCTGDVVTGETYGAGPNTSILAGELRDVIAPCACEVAAGLDFFDVDSEIAALSMSAELTIDSWWDGNPGYPTFSDGGLALLRCKGQRGEFFQFGYEFSVSGLYHDRTNGSAQLTASDHDTLGTTVLGTIASGVNCVDGGVIELSVIGSAIVARWNGSTLFSVTDSSVPGITSIEHRRMQYAAYRHSQQGNTTCTSSGFAVTPVCP